MSSLNVSIRPKHPPGMYLLAFTELFERLSYYTLSFLLVLFASDSVTHGGLGWTKEEALALVSTYTFAAFTLPIIGGLLADKVLGAFRSALFGGMLIICGHLVMFFADAEHLTTFYVALFLVAFGTAFFKPCLPSLLGRLYPENSPHREAGFSYYYVGINIGAMIAGFSSGLLLQSYGYRWALSSAAFGMMAGLVVFALGRRWIIIPETNTSTKEVHKQQQGQTTAQKKALGYLGLAYVFFAVWAVVYNLVLSGTLTLYIENYTAKTVFGYNIPTTFFQSLESFGILISAPSLIALYRCFGSKRALHFFSQMNIALLLSATALSFLTFMAHHLSAVDLSTVEHFTPFSWYQMSILILIVAVSEVMISPVMMSAISVLSPPRYKTVFQSFLLFIIGTMSIVAGKIGALSLHQPFITFAWVTGVAAVMVIFYGLVRKSMINVAQLVTEKE
jgi:POT family proton-dependent oligopeptide transporter